MKKILAVGLFLAIILSCAGCGGAQSSESISSTGSATSQLESSVSVSVVSEISPTGGAADKDFLDDEELRTSLFPSLKAYEMEPIITALENYIAENDPAETDSAYSILDKAIVMRDALMSCTVIRDDFEETTTIFYNGVDEIGENIHFVPYCSYTVMSAKCGLVSGGWTFFDHIQAKIDGERAYTMLLIDYFDVIRETIGGGVIEYVDMGISSTDCKTLIGASEIDIRFMNEEDGSTYDFALSEEEVNAANAISALSLYFGDLSLAFQFG